MSYVSTEQPFHEPPGLTTPEPRHTVIIVGAGPVGLALAIDLALHGIACVVLDDNNVVSVGSRAICWSKRSLEIFDRLGIGSRVVEKGVIWKVGRTHHGDREIFNFDLLPEAGHKMPAFVNLQQYYVEEFLIDRARDFPDLIDLRFQNTVVAVEQTENHASVSIETPAGPYTLDAEYVVACDGAGSPIRQMLDLDFIGELFEERFLIADIRMEADFPSERWFWFEPAFHPGQSALLHKQPDNIYRIDLQLGWNADPEEERKPENVIPRIEKIVDGRPFEIDWVSVYSFQCRRLERFVHDRIIFAGDAAHVVSPFGARGGNGGLQDIDNLGWKLAAIVKGDAESGLLERYNSERIHGADENIRHSAGATRFMSPNDGIERLFRDSVLSLAAHAPFARTLVNSGRLSVPCIYPVKGEDVDSLPSVSCPGSVAPDTPVGDDWLINRLGGEVVVLAIDKPALTVPGAKSLEIKSNPMIQQRYLGTEPGACYLIRPDQVIAARWSDPDILDIQSAITRLWADAS